MSSSLRFVRYILSFPIGILVYVFGFWAGSILGSLSVSILAILPPFIDTESAGLTAAALGANILSMIAFEKVIPKGSFKNKWMLAFAIILLIIGIAYFLSCFFYSEMNLLWYGILSICFGVYYVYSNINHKEKQNEAL